LAFVFGEEGGRYNGKVKSKDTGLKTRHYNGRYNGKIKSKYTGLKTRRYNGRVKDRTLKTKGCGTRNSTIA
jgi:hypothetical protein